MSAEIPIDKNGNPLPPSNEAIAKAIIREIEALFPFPPVGQSLGDWLDRLRRSEPVELTRRLSALYKWSRTQATFSEPVRLPDGSGCFTASLPLPKDHWLYAEHDNEPPMPFRTGTESPARDLLVMQVRNAARYAIRASTMNGKETDFDPDAMVQNMVVGLLGRWTKDGR